MISRKYLYIIIALTVFANISTAATLDKVTINNASARQAICNDGSEANFYFRAATNPAQKNVWVVDLKGGGGCSSFDECKARHLADYDAGGALVDEPKTTAWTRASIIENGIFKDAATKVSSFSGANLVFIPYCSSDYWAGTVDRSSTSGLKVYFKGYYIVKAVIEDLMDSGSPVFISQGEAARPISSGDVVVLAGSSAGASGVRNNLDRVASAIAGKYPGNLVLGVSDAAFKPSFPVTRVIDDFFGLMPDDSCVVDSYTTSPSDCSSLSFLVRHKHIETPLFYIVNLIDRKSMENDGMISNDVDDQVYFAETLRAMGRWVEQLSLPANQPFGIFSHCDKDASGVGTHTTLLGQSYLQAFNTDKGLISIDEVLSNWVESHRSGVTIAPTQASVSVCP